MKEQAEIEETLTFCPVCNSPQIVHESTKNKLFSCRNCLVYFTNPRPVQDFIVENYSFGGYYKKFKPDENWEGMWKRRVERVLNRVPSGRILDMGSGIGTFLHMCRDFAFECVGTEISKEAIVRAKELYNLDLLCGYVEDLELENNSFDAITMWHVFEHLPYPGKTLQYLHGKLKKGGYLFIAVPNNSYWKIFYSPFFLLSSKKRKLEALIPPISYENRFKEIHLIHFAPESLRRVVEPRGFKMKELTMDNISLRPGKIKDFKYLARNFLARHLRIYTHEALFLCAQKF
jgi:2-polyprenyl-3-methyl-5-hydroxy-6-metoxy-1,4-benzoquinol methylase